MSMTSLGVRSRTIAPRLGMRCTMPFFSSSKSASRTSARCVLKRSHKSCSTSRSRGWRRPKTMSSSSRVAIFSAVARSWPWDSASEAAGGRPERCRLSGAEDRRFGARKAMRELTVFLSPPPSASAPEIVVYNIVYNAVSLSKSRSRVVSRPREVLKRQKANNAGASIERRLVRGGSDDTVQK